MSALGAAHIYCVALPIGHHLPFIVDILIICIASFVLSEDLKEHSDPSGYNFYCDDIQAQRYGEKPLALVQTSCLAEASC